jgi:hypothetical protein
MSDVEGLIYPIGRFVWLGAFSVEERLAALEVLASLPGSLAEAVAGLSESELDTPYRVGGWNIRQIVHHLADSDMTAYSWMRLALTEDWPVVYDYDPAALAALGDSGLTVEVSLGLLEGLHARWVATLRGVAEADWVARGYVHPESGRCSLEHALAMYAWHSRHHLAQILECRRRFGW